MRITCNQCEAMTINGVFCHETGCPNQYKTWVADREEWICFVECFECGCEVEEGEYCSCCDELSDEELLAVAK